MHKQKEWASFRITTLLYFIIILLSLNFYFVHTSFETMQNNTKVMHKTGWLEGTLAYSSEQNSKQTSQRIDKALQDISFWAEQNKDSEFYTGGQTLAKDVLELSSCIEKDSISCGKIAKNLDSIVKNIVYPKQDKLINMIYLSFALSIFFILYLIYFIRLYIHQQIKKHAIYDLETKLFNKKYFLAELKAICPRSVRHKFPLSILSISIVDFDKKDNTYDKKTKKDILKAFGDLIVSLTRISDVACRYEENSFYIILPFTEEKGALILEEHIREVLEKHDFMATPELKFKFATTQFNDEETPEAFVKRTQNLLSS